MFLLVPAYPGCPRQNPEGRNVCVCAQRLLSLSSRLSRSPSAIVELLIRIDMCTRVHYNIMMTKYVAKN